MEDHKKDVEDIKLKYDQLRVKEEIILSSMEYLDPEELGLMMREMSYIPSHIISKLKV